MELVTRFFDPPGQSYYLFGPRGTGKSLWTQQAYPSALRLDLLQPDLHRVYAAQPERLRELVAGHPNASTIVIDEVQRVPELLSVVHALIERNRSLRFVLTGSSTRKLRRAGVDLMAGRAMQRHLHPYMASELGPRFNLERALTIGMVPLIVEARESAEAKRINSITGARGGGNEVDLICYGPDGLFAIEVKNGAVLHPEDFRGLIAFGTDYPESRRILLYGGQERLRRNHVLCLPVTDFLQKLHPRQPFPAE